MKAVIYSRVSTEKQASKGLSLDTQIANCSRYAEANSFEVVDIILDAQTAKNTNRPGLQRILKMANSRKIQHVIVWNIDRLTRSLIDNLMMNQLFSKKGILVHEAEKNRPRVATTSEGKLFNGLEMIVKEFERDKISDRTKTVLAEKRQRGLRISGRAPFGYHFTEDGKVELDSREQSIIQRIHNLKSEGFSIRAIQQRLSDDGVINRMGKPIGRNEIWNIVKRAA